MASSAQQATASADGRVLAVVAVLGLNAWASVAALPAWHLQADSDLSLAALLLTTLAPIPLVLGLWLLRARHDRSHLALLLAFPLALLLPALAQPSMVRASVLSAAAVAFASLGLAGYLLAACWARGRLSTCLVTSRSAPTKRALRRPTMRAYYVALPVAAGVTAAVIIGAAHLLPQPATEGGDGSHGVVTSTMALSLWALTFLVVFVPAARKPRLGLLPLPSRGAALVWLVVLAIAAAMLLASDG